MAKTRGKSKAAKAKAVQHCSKQGRAVQKGKKKTALASGMCQTKGPVNHR